MAYWIQNNDWFFYFNVALAVGLVTAAHVMSFMQKSRDMNKNYYYVLMVLFHFCVTYITLYCTTPYTLSDPMVLVQHSVGSTFSSAAFTFLLYRHETIPGFKDLSPVFFGGPVAFLILFTWIIKWHDFATNGLMAIWMFIFGIFIWFETDFAKEHKLKVKDNFLSLVFVYFEFLVFLYCLCSQVGDM